MRTLTLTSLALAALTTAAAADPMRLTDGQMDQVNAGYFYPGNKWAYQNNSNHTLQNISQYVTTNAVAAGGHFNSAYANSKVKASNSNATYQSNSSFQ